jgi:hypothetical protein
MRTLLLLILPLLLPAASARADSLNDALRMVEEGRYDQARSLLQTLVDGGNMKAHFELGTMYLEGLGTPKDHRRAFRLLRKAAEHGVPPAQFNLAMMYLKGLGVAPDSAKAYAWMRRADSNDLYAANYTLGLWSWLGIGTQRDPAAAARYFHDVLRLEDDEEVLNRARYYYGLACLEEPTEERGYEEAYGAFHRLAETGHGEAMYYLGIIHFQGLYKAPSWKWALHWMERAGRAGHTPAYHALAGWRAEGVGVLQDYIEALKWEMIAAGGEELAPEQELGAWLMANLPPHAVEEARRRSAAWSSEPESRSE